MISFKENQLITYSVQHDTWLASLYGDVVKYVLAEKKKKKIFYFLLLLNSTWNFSPMSLGLFVNYFYSTVLSIQLLIYLPLSTNNFLSSQ